MRQRVDFIRDMFLGAPGTDEERFYETTRQWMTLRLREKRYIVYTAHADETEVSCAGILLYDLPPVPNRPQRQVGHILNFYTYPKFRRRGYGAALIEHIKEDAPRHNITRLFLNAAPMGESIYRKAGFAEQHEKALILELV